jgi:putative DNA primase/helicase
MVERPECRQFRIPDIIGYTRKNRNELIRSALGILSGWLASKGPKPKPSLGSFETWSDVVRGAILWSGGADVVDALASQVEGADDGAQIHRALLESWKDTLSLSHSAASLLSRCRDPKDLESSEFAAILAELCPGKGSAIHGTAQTLSARLRAMEGRVREVNGVQMVLKRSESKGPAQWEVKEV